jgi:hypothetical protein
MGELALPSLHPDRYRILRQRTQLDLMRLDEELSEMSVVLHEAGELAVLAAELSDRKKADLEITSAMIAAELRGNVGDSGKAPSETRIASEIPQHPDYVTALDVYGQAKLDAALWRNLQDALRTKSSSIRAAADLIAAGYLTADHITNQRRKEIRGVPQPRS